jgi:hypothetical protein
MRGPLLAFALLLPLAAAAGPTDPAVIEHPDDALGAPQSVGFRTLADLPQAYVEEELFVSGAATVYTTGGLAHRHPPSQEQFPTSRD